MYFVDPLKKVVLASQYGKQVLQRLRVRPSTAISLDEPHFESASLPEVLAVVRMPAIYEEHQMPAVYPSPLEYEQPELWVIPEMSFTPVFRLEPVQPMVVEARVEPELSAVAEISQAIDVARHPDSLDGLLQQPDMLEPSGQRGLDSLLDDPLLGPLGPLF